jgi:hypothetical protein
MGAATELSISAGCLSTMYAVEALLLFAGVVLHVLQALHAHVDGPVW